MYARKNLLTLGRGGSCSARDSAWLASFQEVAVDAERFDRLVESLTRSGTRRGVMRTLTGAILGAVGLGALAGHDAAGKVKGKRRGKGQGKNRKDKNRVRAQAASCCSGGNCAPKAGKNLAKCCYEDQNLAGQNFKGANLGNANFTGATLTNANFSGANLDKTCFVDADVTGAKFTGANTGTAIFCRTRTSQGVNNSGCGKDNGCCQTCVDVGDPGCNIGGECCGGAECTGNGDGVCTCPQETPDTCEGACVDLDTDDTNCGECGNVCPSDETCEGGACRCGSGPACGSGLTCCNGACVNLLTDLNNCTACGNACPAEGPNGIQNALVECGPGRDEDDRPGYGCTFLCNTGFADCDDDPFNGCERPISNDSNNCGKCGFSCPDDRPRCCGCSCFTNVPPDAPIVPCSTCQTVGNARLIRRR